MKSFNILVLIGLFSCAIAHEPCMSDREKIEYLKQKAQEVPQDDNALQVIFKSPYTARLISVGGILGATATGAGVYVLGLMQYGGREGMAPVWHSDPYFYGAIAAAVFQAVPFAVVLKDPDQKEGSEGRSIAFVALSIAHVAINIGAMQIQPILSLAAVPVIAFDLFNIIRYGLVKPSKKTATE
jgi:hypothetical protein